MAHKEQNEFIYRTKERFLHHFTNKKVLGIGTFDVCGTEDAYFDNCDYAGLDLGPGPGVDIVCPAQDYDAPDSTYDTIISCECFEHNPYYKETLQNAARLLKSGGMLVFTCATTGRPVHGTSSLEEESKKKFPNWKTMPNVSRENWDNDYYQNLTELDIRECINIEKIFSSFLFEVEGNHHDLFFWGIKR